MTADLAQQLADALAQVERLERALNTFVGLEPVPPASAIELRDACNVNANLKKQMVEIQNENARLSREMGLWKTAKERKRQDREVRKFRQAARIERNGIPF